MYLRAYELSSSGPTAEILYGDQQAAEEDPRGYLERMWDRFVALEPKILDLQHRAALAVQRARAAGDQQREDQARQVLLRLGDLAQLHIRIVDQAQGVAEYIGLGAYPTGTRLGAIPAAALAVITTVAALVAWVFRSYAAEERKLELIEAGVLTPEQAAALDPGPRPAGLVGELRGVLLWGALAVVALMVAQRFVGPRRNPPLMIYGRNPPGPIGQDVHAVYYTHAEDGEYYVHEFDGDVEMVALDDGSVLLRAPVPLWEDFE